ncbi:YopX family protein [Sporolactobacillus terrae]|uniref:YopX family protein n=1 Tax=Sporolactobacillus terrae TaxID=269673 RepID=UPI0006887196|nr:YopX family protein [Sporolactobacillus terrae]
MRRVKFRFYSDLTKKMYQLTMMGLHYEYDEDPAVFVGDYVPDELLGGTRVQRYSDGHVMQYTGLKDKNGREIYEGDILGTFGDRLIGKVIFDEDIAAFVFETDTFKDWLPNYLGGAGSEIIGNIYENCELVEGDA